MSSPARRTNTILTLIAVAVLIAAFVVAIFGSPTSAPSVDDVSNETTVPNTSPGNNSSNQSTSLIRDADTSASWFSHTFASEQFDFPMDQLDCNEMERFFSLELCVVARTARGDFMVTATEGFWDPQSSSRNPVDIELNFMVYVHTAANGPARAMSVLDGYVSAPYGSARSVVQASTFSVSKSDVVVLEWSSADDDTRRASRTWSSVQVLAMNSSGLPEVVATYGGTNISISSNSGALVLTSERFGPPTRTNEAEPWLTVLALSPPSSSSSTSWRETVSSESTASFDDSSLLSATSESTYEFPRRGGTSQSLN